MILYRALAFTAAALILVILAGTVYGLLRQGKLRGEQAPFPAETAGGAVESVFTGLGTMRIATADSEPETIVISVAFPYNKNDRPFSEELASRISFFRSATEEYLGAMTAEEIAALDPASVNEELLVRYNAALRLGQIREIFILEFMRL
jgi:flagellar basal body-associated protein FliL